MRCPILSPTSRAPEAAFGKLESSRFRSRPIGERNHESTGGLTATVVYSLRLIINLNFASEFALLPSGK